MEAVSSTETSVSAYKSTAWCPNLKDANLMFIIAQQRSRIAEILFADILCIARPHSLHVRPSVRPSVLKKKGNDPTRAARSRLPRLPSLLESCPILVKASLWSTCHRQAPSNLKFALLK
jgi:hypothetical protein